MELDVKIQAGCVFDGSGNAPSFVDLGIRADRIVEIGDLSHREAKEEIDATGCLICPGFIDAHSHSDTYLLIEPSAASKVFQGITTEICGQCGASAAPLLGNYRLPVDWEGKSYPGTWKTIAEYRTLFDQVRPAINAALLVGHNTLHAGVCGYEARTARPDELKKMDCVLEQALDEGAIGMSSGLAYPPGSAVEKEELIALCRTVARHNGTYATHMRSESGGLLKAIDEAIEIAEKGGARLHISHLKASGEANWNKISQAFEKIEAAQRRMEINADRYPYTAGSTDLDILLPQWASYGGRTAVMERIRTPKTRSKILEELSTHPSSYWANVMIGSCKTEAFRGKFLPEMAKELSTSEAETFLQLIEADELSTGGIFFSMSEKNLWRVLAKPYVSIGSDGSMRAPWGSLSEDHPHPRSYGSHTRFLRAALDEKTVPLAEAIRKMTSLPAKQYGLKKRGLLQKGYFADIAIFKPKEVKENSTYGDPHQLSSGLQYLFVNGIHTVDKGKITSCFGGRFLAS